MWIFENISKEFQCGFLEMFQENFMKDFLKDHCRVFFIFFFKKTLNGDFQRFFSQTPSQYLKGH